MNVTETRKVWKLTSHENTTHGGTVWTPGEWKGPLTGEGGLCGPGFFHFYEGPLTAAFMNPVHAGFEKPRLWEAEARGAFTFDGPLKGGATEMRILAEAEIPAPTPTQRAAFSILCALEAGGECLPKEWLGWASRWLSGEDRSEAAAAEAAEAAEAAAWAAEAAAEAAAWAAAWAARAAWAAAEWAARGAMAAAWAADILPIDVEALARKAMAEF